MRILANFTKKVSTGQYENEQFMVTIEAESEFNNIDQIADYLFHQARAAVDRQINGTAATGSPATTIPAPQTQPQAASSPRQGAPKPQEKQAPASNGNGNGSVLPVTDRQAGMLKRLLGEVFNNKSEAARWLKQGTGTDRVNELSRRQASRTIESLMDMKRESA